MHISWKAMSAKRDCSRRHLMMIENTALKGTVNMVLKGPDGRVKAHKTIRNKVMNAGIAHIVGRMIDPNQTGIDGDHTFPSMMRYMGIGSGTTKNIGSNDTGTAVLARPNQNGYTGVNRSGFDLESGGFPGSEYRLENELTGQIAAETPQDPGNATVADRKLKGRVDMAHYNYTSGGFGNLVANTAGPQNIPAGTASTAITREQTTDLFQGFLNSNNSLLKSQGTNGNTAEGTVTWDAGTTSHTLLRIADFTNLENFVGGYTDAHYASATYPVFGNQFVSGAAFTTRQAAAKKSQIAWLAYWDGVTDTTGTQTAAKSAADGVSGGLTLGAYGSGQSPVHLGGSGVTTTTGLGSPVDKQHQRALYTANSKKQGDRLVFIALFPPNSPYGGTDQAPITEAGIFNNPNALVTSQTMLCRTVFAVVTKQPEDSLQITWSIAFQDSTPVS